MFSIYILLPRALLLGYGLVYIRKSVSAVLVYPFRYQRLWKCPLQ